MSEPIVARDYIREHARQAAAAGKQQHEANPYPEGSTASMHWERDYLDCVRELEADSAVV